MGVYEDLVDFLFDGAVPVEEIRKINDISEGHVVSPLKVQNTLKKKKKAWEEKTGPEKIGVGTSVLGAVSGPAAIYGAVRSAKEGKGGMPRDFIRSAGGEKGKKFARYLDSPKSKPAKIAAGTAGAGLVGLQSANWIGDAINARQLSRSKSEMISDVTERSRVKKMIHDAVMAGVPSDEVMELVEKANMKVYQPAQLIRGGQRLVGAALASGVAGGGYLLGRKQTDKTVDEALDERGIPQRVIPTAPATAAAKPRTVLKPMAQKTVDTTVPVVMQSKYVPEMPKKDEVKKADGDELLWEGEITKVDTDKQHVFGWCSIAKVNGEPVVDRQDDYIPVEEMERSAYDYVLHSRKGGDMHQRDGEHPLHKSDMIESFVVTPEKLEKMGIDPETVPHGWWVGFKVNDDQLWNEVKDGKKSYFSVHGRGRRVKEYI